jgi:preprotein translocase subunit SecE
MSMNLNREQKRAMRKMGSLNENDAPTRAERQTPQTKQKAERTPFMQYLREVRGELRKVAWPTREEVKNYSIVVLITVLIFTALVAGLDFGFGKLAVWFFDRG